MQFKILSMKKYIVQNNILVLQIFKSQLRSNCVISNKLPYVVHLSQSCNVSFVCIYLSLISNVTFLLHLSQSYK